MITDVSIKPGCIACGTCERICPQVFQVKGTSQVISKEYASNATALLEAETSCPVNVIQVEQEGVIKQTQAPVFHKTSLQTTTYLTKDVIELKLHCKRSLSYKPGQFVMIAMKDAKGEFLRSYSIVRYQDNVITLCIKLSATSRSSAYLLARKKGETLRVSPPKGTFVLQQQQYTKPKLFIVTGTGIAPIISMLEADPVSKKIVLFGVQRESDIFYEEKIKKIPNTQLVFALSQPDDEWQGLRGRVTAHLERINMPQDTEIYLCGNPTMVEDVVRYYKQHSFPEEHIYFEKYTKQEDGTEAIFKKRNILQRILIDGELPFISVLRSMIFYSSFAILLGLPFFHTGFRELGTQGWYVLIAVLLIRPIAELFPKIKLFTRLIPMRKELGILSAVLILAHSYGYFLDGGLSLFQEILRPQFWKASGHFFWGSIGAIVGAILLLTSNTFSVTLLKQWWKRIQRFAYLFFIFGAIHVMLIQPSEIPKWSIIIALLLGTRIAAYYSKLLTQPT